MTALKRPPQALPLLYLGTAHVALALACLLAGLWPQAVAGFFYHAWLIGLVHLVTLGWITFSILGAIYIVGPLALGMDLPARHLDYVAYALALVGLIGMVGEEGLQEFTYANALKDSINKSFDKVKGGWLGVTDKYWAAALIPSQTEPFKATFAAQKARNSSDQDVPITPAATRGAAENDTLSETNANRNTAAAMISARRRKSFCSASSVATTVR
jgi:hypothetical protein